MSSRQTVEKIGFILLGTIVLSFGFYNFYFLNHITEGGVLGFLLILKNLFGVHPSMASIIIDFSLLLLGYRIFGKEFFLYSLFASFAFSITYGIFENIGPNVARGVSILDYLPENFVINSVKVVNSGVTLERGTHYNYDENANPLLITDINNSLNIEPKNILVVTINGKILNIES